MKKKIIGLFVCMLLIAVVFPVVKSVNDSIDAPILQYKNAQSSSLENWIEIQKLLPSDGATGDGFGYSVSFSGDTVLIGTIYDDDNGYNSGSAYVFTRTGTIWTQQAKLLASDGATIDNFGRSVSIYGNTALIGADNDDNGRGSAYVFTRTGTTWTQQQKLNALDGAVGDVFGYSVSLDGNTALIGAFLDDDNGVDTGSAYVFTRTGTTWTQQQKLLASDGAAVDMFGRSVSLNIDTALIGAPEDDDMGTGSGSAYIFTRTGTTWTQQAKLLASDGATGDYFGEEVSINENTALIGAYYNDDYGPDSGSAYVFTRTGTTWTQQQKLLASDSAAYDCFGYEVSIDENTALIGAPGDDDNGNTSGAAYVFARTGTTWTEQAKLLASDGAAEDTFGESISIDGDTAFIGASYDDYMGSVYVFKKNQSPIFGTPTPANGSINNPLSLTWSIPIIDPEGDLFSWTIQCSNGQTNSSIGVTNGTKILSLSGLASLTTYRIWVNATDPNGSEIHTREWYIFTIKENQPPTIPTITGSTKGKVNTSYEYKFSTTDLDGDNLYYYIDWDDGSYAEWIGPILPGESLMASHIWTAKDTYVIKGKAKDTSGAESGWGTLSVTMPYSYNLPFMQFWIKLFERFPNAFPLLRHLMGY